MRFGTHAALCDKTFWSTSILMKAKKSKSTSGRTSLPYPCHTHLIYVKRVILRFSLNHLILVSSFITNGMTPKTGFYFKRKRGQPTLPLPQLGIDIIESYTAFFRKIKTEITINKAVSSGASLSSYGESLALTEFMEKGDTTTGIPHKNIRWHFINIFATFKQKSRVEMCVYV